MLKSMTGFGEASAGTGQNRCSVEIRSVNHRYFDYSSRLPQFLATLDNDLKNLVRAKIKRGKITLSLSFNENQLQKEEVVFDEKKITFYIQNLIRIAKKLKLQSSLSLSDIVALPEVFLVEKREYNLKEKWPQIKRTVEKTLYNLIRNKIKEGRVLAGDILKRLNLIAVSLKKIKKQSPRLILSYKNKLASRIKELTRGLELEEERLSKEAALFAEKSDISEEILRLESHLDLFRNVLTQDEVGKRLDFIVQEMNRETNTMAAKSLDFKISAEVVKIKTELEKIREQLQNVE